MGHDFGGVSNPAQTRVGYKEIRKRALQDHNPDALIGLEFPAKFFEVLRQNFVEKIYRRVIDADECNSRLKREPETFVIRVSHTSGSISVRTRASALRGRRDSLADTGDVASTRCGRRIPPAAADEIDQIGNILIAQPPGESGHRELRRRLRRAWRLRTGEHDRNQRNRVWSFDNRIAGQAWKHAVVSLAVGSMAGGAVIKVEESSGLARIAVL